MIQHFKYIALEFFVLFICLPASLAFAIPLAVKVSAVIIAFVYVLFLLKKNESITFTISKQLQWGLYLKRTAITFLIIAISTTLYVWFTAPSALFYVPKNNPLLFLLILIVYSVLSVWPQELIYRTFFMERYAVLFKTKALLIFVNAIVFSLAHLFFRNLLVLVLTFIGGLLFSYTYIKWRSTTAVTIEHALYGNWLFTVGMGQMLAFPGMESPN